MVDTVTDPVPSAEPTPAPEASAPVVDPAPAPADPAPQPEPAPEDWRKAFAGDNEKMAKWLGRYSTQKDALAAGFEAQNTLRTTRSNVLPENPTEEQIAEYREANGIPKDASGYDLQLSEGLVIGEDDKPIVDAFLSEMHKANAPQSMVTAALNAYYAQQEQQIADLQATDHNDRTNALNTLQAEWGPDFQSNRNALQSLVNQVPEAVRESFQNSRLADGTAMMNSPEILMWLADLSRKTNPAATVVPNSNNPTQAIGDEIAKIEKLMSSGSNEYWKDERMQARYRDLLDAQERMG